MQIINMNESAIKWYRKLAFPSSCDEAFFRLAREKDLSEIDMSDPLGYLIKKNDISLNLIFFLSQCDQMYATFLRQGIDEKYFAATAHELTTGAMNSLKTFGQLGLTDPSWYFCLVRGDRLFRIGRFNFMLEIAGSWCNGGPIHVGDSIVSVHIPSGGHLDDWDSYRSIVEAERFVLKYFPNFHFKYFMCHSWLLYDGFDTFLPESSNIRAFRKLFTPYRQIENDSVISFAFDKRTTRNNIASYPARNSFQKKLQQYILSGGKLFVTCGARSVTHEELHPIDCHYHQMQWFTDDVRSYPSNYIKECADNGSIVEAAQTYMESSYLQAIDVLCMPNMSDLFPSRDLTQNLLGIILKHQNRKVYAHGALFYPEFPAVRDYDFRTQAKVLISMGFDGIKLIEAKPNAHDKLQLPLCHAAYEPFWRFLEQEQIHVLCHVNDPVYCWNPQKNPVGACYSDKFTHYETIYDEIHQLLSSHPLLNITFAHLLFLGYDLPRLSLILDRYPNVTIDITPAEEEYGYLSSNPDSARQFFLRYSRRILFGTDNKNAFSLSFKDNKVQLINRFLRTTDTFHGLVSTITGIGLEPVQLSEILFENYQRILGQTPRPVNVTLLKQYYARMYSQLPTGKTAEMIQQYIENLL